jgi:hypothetical protein
LTGTEFRIKCISNYEVFLLRVKIFLKMSGENDFYRRCRSAAPMRKAATVPAAVKPD